MEDLFDNEKIVMTNKLQEFERGQIVLFHSQGDGWNVTKNIFETPSKKDWFCGIICQRYSFGDLNLQQIPDDIELDERDAYHVMLVGILKFYKLPSLQNDISSLRPKTIKPEEEGVNLTLSKFQAQTRDYIIQQSYNKNDCIHCHNSNISDIDLQFAKLKLQEDNMVYHHHHNYQEQQTSFEKVLLPEAALESPVLARNDLYDVIDKNIIDRWIQFMMQRCLFRWKEFHIKVIQRRMYYSIILQKYIRRHFQKHILSNARKEREREKWWQLHKHFPYVIIHPIKNDDSDTSKVTTYYQVKGTTKVYLPTMVLANAWANEMKAKVNIISKYATISAHDRVSGSIQCWKRTIKRQCGEIRHMAKEEAHSYEY